MATKSRKKTKETTTTTPHLPTSYSSNWSLGRPSSQVSSPRISQIQEKDELRNYGHLATYIERVQHLEPENNQVQISQETVTCDVSRKPMKNTYESELADLRRSLDETAREKAKLQADVRKYRTENEDLTSKLAKKETELSQSEKNVFYYQSRVQFLQLQASQELAHRQRMEEKVKQLTAENDRLTKQLNGVCKRLEEEVLARAQLEMKLQSMKKELVFIEQIHKQLNEVELVGYTNFASPAGARYKLYVESLNTHVYELEKEVAHEKRLVCYLFIALIVLIGILIQLTRY